MKYMYHPVPSLQEMRLPSHPVMKSRKFDPTYFRPVEERYTDRTVQRTICWIISPSRLQLLCEKYVQIPEYHPVPSRPLPDTKRL